MINIDCQETDCQQTILQLNQSSLDSLRRTISRLKGRFCPILAHCNYLCLQQQMLNQLQVEGFGSVAEIRLSESEENLYEAIKAKIQDIHPQCLMIFGLPSVSHLDQFLINLNNSRTKFQNEFSFPLVLWVNDEVIKKFMKIAPDFFSITTSIKFQCAVEQFMSDCVQKTANQVFNKILDIGAGILWNSAALNSGNVIDINMEKGFLRRTQLEAVQEDLNHCGISLTVPLKASLEFLLGHSSDSSLEQRRQHYETSLNLWRELNNLKYQGCLLYCLGIWWNSYALKHPSKRDSSFEKARDCFFQCVEILKQEDTELEAKFINALAESYKRLKQWDDLKKTALRALELHSQYKEVAKQQFKWDSYYRYQAREARAKGFLAEVALENHEWIKAKKLAEEACTLTEEIQSNFKRSQEDLRRKNFLEWQRSYHYGWFLLPLAQAQKHLGNRQEALKNLKTARKETKPQYDPELYIEILKELQDSYYQRNKYLAAFRLKQEQQSIEQQFGFQAFIGAMSLRSKKQVVNPVFITSSPEIRASGREEDIKKLMARMRDTEHKLTIIYGPSGSGRSSILQAGLIPELKRNKEIESHLVIPVIQRVYLNWIQELGRAFTESLKGILDISLSLPLDSIKMEDIVTQIQKQYQENHLTILIFDEFENLFSVCQNQEQRKEFYDFLRACLRIPLIKVIIAVSEDYMRYLLEYDRKENSQESNSSPLDINNILDQEKLYYLGYFSQEEARKIIGILTQETLFSPEPLLIDRLVSDLAKEFGKVSPFELQLVGSQLEKERITTLSQYQDYGSFRELIKGYIKEVIHNCGEKNDKLTYLILYLFTDKFPILRPSRSIVRLTGEIKDADLGQDLNLKNIRLILKILVDSGLVTTWQEGKLKRYQLGQDHLVPLIRDMFKIRYLRLLEKIKQTKGYLREIFQLKALDLQSQTLLQNYNQLEALLTTVNLGKKLQAAKTQSDEVDHLKNKTLHRLQKLVYDIQESNRLEKHTNDVYQVSFSPDGQKIASASWDKTVKFWNLQGVLLQSFEGHEKGVNSVTFSTDGQLLASASGDYTIKLWTLDGTCIKTIQDHEDWVWDVKFSPDGQLLASASSDGTVRLRNLSNENEKIEPLPHKGRVFRVSFSPNSQFLVSAGHDRTIKIWHRGENNCFTLKKTIQTGDIENIDDIVYTLSFSPDGNTIAAGGWDKIIKIWGLDGTLLKSLSGHEDCINSVSFSSDGKLLASASNDKTVKLWNLKHNTCIKTFRGHENWINSVSFSPDNQLLASGGDDNKIRLWKFEIPLLNSFQGHTKKIHGVAISRCGKYIASASWDKSIKLWNLDGTALKTIPAHDNWVWDVCFSPDGQTLASAGGDKMVKLWDIETGNLKKQLPEQRACVHSVSFSPNGQLLAFGSDEIKLWQFSEGMWQDTEIFGEQNPNDIWQVRFSPDGKLLAVANSEPMIELWDLDGKLFKKLQSSQGHIEWINSISFSPDSQFLISAGNDAKIVLWDVNQGTIVKQVEGHRVRIYSVAFSPDGKIIASASADRTIKLWTRDFTLLRTLEGHTGWVNSLCFTPNSKILISGSSDKTIKLWDLEKIQSNLKEDQIGDEQVSEFDHLLKWGDRWLEDYVETHPSRLMEPSPNI